MKNKVHTALVVDDDPVGLDFLSRTVGSEYPVLRESNGDDALRTAQRAEPDVIILNVIMAGGKDGFSTFAELQNDSRTQDIPVLMLSDVNHRMGMTFDSDIIKQHLGRPPAAFLEKPISAERLMNAVRDALHNEGPDIEDFPDSAAKTGGKRTTRRHRDGVA